MPPSFHLSPEKGSRKTSETSWCKNKRWVKFISIIIDVQIMYHHRQEPLNLACVKFCFLVYWK
jgi:hypothetical protein